MQDNQNYQPQNPLQQPNAQAQALGQMQEGTNMQAAASYMPNAQYTQTMPQQVLQKPKTSPVVWVLLVLLILTLVGFGGYVYYKEFYESSTNEESTETESQITNPTNSVMPTLEFSVTSLDEAYDSISMAMYDLNLLNTVNYKVMGSDSEQEFDEQYFHDIEKNIIKIISNATSTYGPVVEDGLAERIYYKIGNDYYENGNYDNTLTEDEVALTDLSINTLSELLDMYLVDDRYTVKYSSTKVSYNGEQVNKLTLNYEIKDNTSSLFGFYNVYADIVLEKYTIEVYIDNSGKLVKVTLPNGGYGKLTYEFSKFDEELTFDLPENLL